jgi:rhodanese-related sulfurtransferase
MWWKSLCVVLIAVFVFTAAQAEVKSPKQISEEAKQGIEQISVDDLKSKIAAGDELLLIDVRTEKEYLCGHIQGAVWIPRGKAEFGIQKITQNADTTVVVYCRTGTRSALVTHALTGVGYENVLNLDGGFRDWARSGNSLFNMHGEIKVVEFEKEESAEKTQGD